MNTYNNILFILLFLTKYISATEENVESLSNRNDLNMSEYADDILNRNSSKTFIPFEPHKSSLVSPNNKESACPARPKDIDSLSQEQFLSILIHGCRYDKNIRPDAEGPLNVSVQMDIKAIDAPEHQQFRMNLLLNFRYTDYRLRYAKLSPKRQIIVGDDSLKSKIWVPHILVTNDRQSPVMGLEGKDTFITINRYGEVTISCRMSVSIHCWMNLKKFPFDKQKCTLSFRSWTYKANSIILHWDHYHPVQIAHELHLTQFALLKYSTYSQIVEEPSFEIMGNYSMVTFEFIIAREIGYYMLDYFIPSCLLVAATWGTFWLQADNTPARTTLGTSPMLAFITLAQGQNRALPKVSYIKASDIWFLMCAIFIFASMAEFFFVNVIWRRKKQVDVKKINSKYILKSTITPRLAKRELEMSNLSLNRQANKESIALYDTYLRTGDYADSTPSRCSQIEDEMDPQLSIPIPTNNEQKLDGQVQPWTSMTPQEVSIWIDRRSRVIFPLAFLVCNILYWTFVYAF